MLQEVHAQQPFSLFSFWGAILLPKKAQMSFRYVTAQRLIFGFICTIFRTLDLYNKFYLQSRRVCLKVLDIAVAIEYPENDSSKNDVEKPLLRSSPVKTSAVLDILAIFAMSENADGTMSKCFFCDAPVKNVRTKNIVFFFFRKCSLVGQLLAAFSLIFVHSAFR